MSDDTNHTTIGLRSPSSAAKSAGACGSTSRASSRRRGSRGPHDHSQLQSSHERSLA